uniref:Uncharacterized protein n=1 Tax=Anopheles atroparvus TaxID=41427 RepID=A0A182JHZ9_ANOAO
MANCPKMGPPLAGPRSSGGSNPAAKIDRPAKDGRMPTMRRCNKPASGGMTNSISAPGTASGESAAAKRLRKRLTRSESFWQTDTHGHRHHQLSTNDNDDSTMKVLNIFHALFICNVREVRLSKSRATLAVSRAHLQLVLPLLLIALLAFSHPWIMLNNRCTKCLDWYTIISRVLMTLGIVVLLALDSFQRRLQLLAMLTNLSDYIPLLTPQKSLKSVSRLVLGILILCNSLVLFDLGSTAYRTRSFAFLPGILTGIIVENYILLNAQFCQVLAEKMAHGFNALQRQMTSQANYHGAVRGLLALEDCKQQLSDVFGFRLLLVLLHLLLNISFCAYDLAQKLLSQEAVGGIYHLSVIVTQETTMLFGLCFYYNLLHDKFTNERRGQWTS